MKCLSMTRSHVRTAESASALTRWQSTWRPVRRRGSSNGPASQSQSQAPPARQVQSRMGAARIEYAAAVAMADAAVRVDGIAAHFEAGQPVSARRGVPMRCGRCGEFGHKRPTCGRAGEVRARVACCTECGQDGHTARTCGGESTAETVPLRGVAWRRAYRQELAEQLLCIDCKQPHSTFRVRCRNCAAAAVKRTQNWRQRGFQ